MTGAARTPGPETVRAGLAAAFGAEAGDWRIAFVARNRSHSGVDTFRAVSAAGHDLAVKHYARPRNARRQFRAARTAAARVPGAIRPVFLDAARGLFACHWETGPVLREVLVETGEAARAGPAGDWLRRFHGARARDRAPLSAEARLAWLADTGAELAPADPSAAPGLAGDPTAPAPPGDFAAPAPPGDPDAAAFAAARARLAERGRRLGQAHHTPVILHGDFSIGNVLWPADGPRVLDFSFPRPGPCHLDLARFTTDLALTAVHRTPDGPAAAPPFDAAAARHAFLEAYGLRRAGARWLAFFEEAALIGRWLRLRGQRDTPRRRANLHAVLTLLAERGLLDRTEI